MVSRYCAIIALDPRTGRAEVEYGSLPSTTKELCWLGETVICLKSGRLLSLRTHWLSGPIVKGLFPDSPKVMEQRVEKSAILPTGLGMEILQGLGSECKARET